MRARATAVAALAAAAVVSAAVPATAEVRGRIVGLEAAAGTLRVVLSIAGVEPGVVVDPASVMATLDGEPAQVTVEDRSDVAAVKRRVMLTIDTSGSMAGPGIVGARAAALTFLDSVPADVEVGLVTFSSTAQVVVPLSLERGPIRAAVQRLEARGDTALYDAVALAANALRDSGDRSILLLSDGADDGSTRSLSDVVAVLDRGDAAVNAVAFQNDEVQSALGALSAAAGGRVFAAEQAGQLISTFRQAAEGLDRRLVVSVALPDVVPDGEATVTVSARAGEVTLTDSALATGLRTAAPTPLDFGPTPADPIPAFLRGDTPLYVALSGLFLGSVVVLGTALSALRAPGAGTVRARLAIYTVSGRHPGSATPDPTGSSLRESLVGLADRAVKSRGIEQRLGRALEAGGVPIKPAEWLIVHVGTVILVPLFVLLLTGLNPVLIAVSLVVATMGPLGYLSVKRRMRTKAFLAQLPDVLQLMSGSLSAGYSLPQAVDAVVRQGTEPVAAEFNKALVEARLGAPIEDALDDVATRMGSVDFSWVVMAIRIQREVGGNLAEVLSTVAATLRERERLRRQVQVLSAEGRLSAWVLGLLPVAFGLYLSVARPSYLKPLVTDQIGWLMLIGMGILMTVGAFWLRKVVRVDV